MTNLIAKPTNVPWVSPYIIVSDVDKAVEFYKKAFRFEVRELAPGEDGTTWHAELLYQNQLVMFGKEGGWGNKSKSPLSSGVESPVTLYLYADNVDEYYQHAVANQAQGILPPDDMFWGDRMCQLKDLDGYIWCVATKRAT